MTVMDKAQRLLASGRVKPTPDPVQKFTVRGDHGTYVVLVSADVALCSCPNHGRCSHADAAVRHLLTNRRVAS
jgi:hypothetical protein